MLKWSTQDLIKHRSEPLHFQETLALKADLMARDPEILDVSPITVTGTIRFVDGDFVASVTLGGQLVVPSTRSLQPVDWPVNFTFSEIYVSPTTDKAKYEDGQLLIDIEDDVIDLGPAVADHILLSIPMQILTPAEAADGTMPAGKDWTVISEDDYSASQSEAGNPEFAKLKALFPDEPDDQ
ncbi:YceD family protein [Lacticaseibacillus absianus]|uniref:YceD family protein n=1 Tax=Lacticaseibacillus absianus TaxID=2729623 RepID=UPI0015C9B23E|nr:YceD family protein [Lacticaseibacillus absianus]